jgi:hypothetical protein
MATVVDSAARLGRLVHCAEILPFGCAHFRTGDRGAWRTIGEQGYYERVHFLREEATQFIEPQHLVDILGRLGELVCHASVDWYCRVGTGGVCEGVVKRFEVLRQLECRFYLAMVLIKRPSHVLLAVKSETHLRQVYQWRTLGHVLSLCAWPYPSRCAMVQCAEELLLFFGCDG